MLAKLLQHLILELGIDSEADAPVRTAARTAAVALAQAYKQADLSQLARSFLQLRIYLWEVLRQHTRASDVECIVLASSLDRRLDELMLWSLESYHSERVGDIERQTLVDSLTGTASRDYFQRRLVEELERAERYNTQVTVLLLDMDYLKWINDSHGHLCGDQALQLLATVMRESARGVDVVARFGGDEFAIVMPDSGVEGGKQLAKRVLSGLQAHPLELAPGQHFTLGVSIGIAAYPEHGQTAQQLVEYADKALYEAKSHGGESYRPARQFTSPATASGATGTPLAEVEELRTALQALLRALERL